MPTTRTWATIWQLLVVGLVVVAAAPDTPTPLETSDTPDTNTSPSAPETMPVLAGDSREAPGEPGAEVASSSPTSPPIATSVRVELPTSTSTESAPAAGLSANSRGMADVLKEGVSGAPDSLLAAARTALADSRLPVQVSAPEAVLAPLGELARGLPGELAAAGANQSAAETDDVQRFLPKSSSLFHKEALDADQLSHIDCHLRNLDFCIAGLMGSANRMLPETERELQTRCDEMRTTASCLAIYNHRCATNRVFAVLAPFAQTSSRAGVLLRQAGAQLKLSPQLGRELLGRPAGVTGTATSTGTGTGTGAAGDDQVSLGNFMEMCEPEIVRAREPHQMALRERLFAISKCINVRLPQLAPCLEDLKTAMQVFYEPRRVLPLRPSCCAISRFRACAGSALDNVCGLSSFEQMLDSFETTTDSRAGVGGVGGSGPMAMMRSLQRVCRQAADYKSPLCKELLPPAGMRLAQRRGHKASKLAKALELFSFSPAFQAPGAL